MDSIPDYGYTGPKAKVISSRHDALLSRSLEVTETIQRVTKRNNSFTSSSNSSITSENHLLLLDIEDSLSMLGVEIKKESASSSAFSMLQNMTSNIDKFSKILKSKHSNQGMNVLHDNY